MQCLIQRSFLHHRPLPAPPIPYLQGTHADLPDDLARACIADGRAIPADQSLQQQPTRRQREKAVRA